MTHYNLIHDVGVKCETYLQKSEEIKGSDLIAIIDLSKARQ